MDKRQTIRISKPKKVERKEKAPRKKMKVRKW